MTNIQLTALLQRFMDGTTTVDEETALADFFRSTDDSDRPADIPEDDWLAYREMFAMFETETTADVPTVSQTASQHRIVHRRFAGWLAAAAAVALLIVVWLAGRQGNDSPVLVEQSQPMALLPTGSASDSIASKSEQSATRDSVNRHMRKDEAKTHRPYWQPRPPKMYMAEKTEVKEDRPSGEADADARKIEEAVSQAEMLLQAINAHQAAELDQLQSQTMDVFADTDADADADDGEYDGE